MTTAYIGLGSNLGNRQDYIRGALNMLAENKHIDVVRVSDVVETAALAQTGQRQRSSGTYSCRLISNLPGELFL